MSDYQYNVDLDVFLPTDEGAIDTEASIRGYTQTSRQCLVPIHPLIVRFVDGIVDRNGKLLETGLYAPQKEERRHTQVLSEIFKPFEVYKFRSIGIWLYPVANFQLISYVFSRLSDLVQSSEALIDFSTASNLISTFRRPIEVLDWQSRSALCKIELIYTFTRILQRMWQ